MYKEIIITLILITIFIITIIFCITEFIYNVYINRIPNFKVDSFQKEIVELINKERRKFYLKIIDMDSNLNHIATLKCDDMAIIKYFNHISPVYGSPFDMLDKFHIKYKYAGESIYKGFNKPEIVLKAWLNSSNYRQLILSPKYQYVGIGISKNDEGIYYCISIFIGE
jgi:uncharacterized protein YkwD